MVRNSWQTKKRMIAGDERASQTQRTLEEDMTAKTISLAAVLAMASTMSEKSADVHVAGAAELEQKPHLIVRHLTGGGEIVAPGDILIPAPRPSPAPAQTPDTLES